MIKKIVGEMIGIITNKKGLQYNQNKGRKVIIYKWSQNAPFLGCFFEHQ